MMRSQTEFAAVLRYILSGLSNLITAGLSYTHSLFGQRLALFLVSGQRCGCGGGQKSPLSAHHSLGKTLEPWQAGFPLTSGISLLTSVSLSSYWVHTEWALTPFSAGHRSSPGLLELHIWDQSNVQQASFTAAFLICSYELYTHESWLMLSMFGHSSFSNLLLVWMSHQPRHYQCN